MQYFLFKTLQQGSLKVKIGMSEAVGYTVITPVSGMPISLRSFCAAEAAPADNPTNFKQAPG